MAFCVCLGVGLADAQTPANVTPAPPAPAVPTLETIANAPLACGVSGVPWTEDRAITQTGRARRDGAKLIVGPMTFTNLRGASYRAYTYVGVYTATGLDLLHRDFQEGANYVLVDAARRSSVDMARFPVPSPSGRFFASATAEYGFTPGGVEVVERTERGLRKVAEFARADLADDSCRLTNLTWLGEDRFAVRVLRSTTGEPTGPSFQAVYELRAGRWRLAN